MTAGYRIAYLNSPFCKAHITSGADIHVRIAGFRSIDYKYTDQIGTIDRTLKACYNYRLYICGSVFYLCYCMVSCLQTKISAKAIFSISQDIQSINVRLALEGLPFQSLAASIRTDGRVPSTRYTARGNSKASLPLHSCTARSDSPRSNR